MLLKLGPDPARTCTLFPRIADAWPDSQLHKILLLVAARLVHIGVVELHSKIIRDALVLSFTERYEICGLAIRLCTRAGLEQVKILRLLLLCPLELHFVVLGASERVQVDELEQA